MIRPLLDVSEVLLDPMFADTFVVIRRQQGTNSSGEPYVIAATTYKFPSECKKGDTNVRSRDCIGVVSPSGANSLVRADAYESQNKSLQVITRFRLQGAFQDNSTPPKQYLPDIVVWDGGNYLVQLVDDFSHYGAGFIQADCLLTDYIPQQTPRD